MYPRINEVVEITEKELKCKFSPISDFDFMFEAGKDYCLYAPLSMYANDEYFVFKLYEPEYEKLIEHVISLLVIRHFGGFISILKFSSLKNVLTKKTFIENEETNEKYYELHIYKDHIQAKNSQIVIKTDLIQV
ncbi:MAG: hypothetical protein K6F77_03700 [Lachnospiraceae bacterium]|nr:hypothetical protein [Lachnospiraceae bacterium]